MDKENLHLLHEQWEVTGPADWDDGSGCWSGKSAPYVLTRPCSPPSSWPEDSAKPRDFYSSWDVEPAGSHCATVMGDEALLHCPRSLLLWFRMSVCSRAAWGCGERTVPSTDLASSCFNELQCQCTAQTNLFLYQRELSCGS